MVSVTQAAGKALSPVHSIQGQEVRVTTQPEGSPQGENQVRQITEQEVQQAVQQANIKIAGLNERIGFGYDKRLNQLYVRVVDQVSGETVREIPPKEFIEHRAAMKEMVGLILDERV